MSFALEVDDLGEFEEFILARRDVNLADSQRNTLFQETRSHGRRHRRWLLLSHGYGTVAGVLYVEKPRPW